MPELRGLGAEAESRAAEYLLGAGYTIVTRRYRRPGGEVDIVALDGEVLVFVEVKCRRTAGFLPEESLGEAKLKSLRKIMGIYVAEMEAAHRRRRLDLIAIDVNGLRHHKDILAP